MLTLPGVQTPAEIQLAIRSGADVPDETPIAVAFAVART